MEVHVSTDAGMRGSQGTTSLRSKISAEEVWWCGLPYPTPKNSTGAHGNLNASRYRDEVLTPYNAAHNEPPLGSFSAWQRSAAHSSCYCWLSSQPERNSAPWPFKSLDLNPIEHLWMTWIDACAVVNQRRKLCKNCSRLLSKNGGEFRKTVFVDW